MIIRFDSIHVVSISGPHNMYSAGELLWSDRARCALYQREAGYGSLKEHV